MALVKCGDCGREVSDKAQACIGCGAPIMAAGTVQSIGTPVVTTELTSKQLKAHTALSIGCIVLGIIILAGSDSEGGNMVSALILIVGFVWLVVTRIRAWWHHS